MSNHELTELEQKVIDFLKTNPGCYEYVIVAFMTGWHPARTKQAISNLVSLNYIAGSATQPLTYHVVAGKEF